MQGNGTENDAGQPAAHKVAGADGGPLGQRHLMKGQRKAVAGQRKAVEAQSEVRGRRNAVEAQGKAVLKVQWKGTSSFSVPRLKSINGHAEMFRLSIHAVSSPTSERTRNLL